MESIDVVFLPLHSLKMNAPPLLKPINIKLGSRDIFTDVIRVSIPGDNFYACQLALAAGFTLFHGKIVRNQTCGQLPVVSIHSFVIYIFIKLMKYFPRFVLNL